MEQTIRRLQIGSFLFTAAAGTLLHFLYDRSGQNPFVGVFSAVNESVWEHMKLLFFPMLAAAVAEGRTLGQRGGFWCVKLLGAAVGLALIPGLYYTYTGALGVHLTWADIAIYYVAAAAAYLSETKLLLRDHRRTCRFSGLAWALMAAVAFAFLWFTFFPPHLPIFQDPISGGYGIGGV